MCRSHTDQIFPFKYFIIDHINYQLNFSIYVANGGHCYATLTKTDIHLIVFDRPVYREIQLIALTLMHQSVPSTNTPPPEDPRGNFLSCQKPRPGAKFFCKSTASGTRKYLPPGSIVKDLVSFSCWSASKFWNFAEIKPLKELEGCSSHIL